MRKNIVAGNWKMNTTLAEGLALAKGLDEALKGKTPNCDVIIGTPFTHLASVAAPVIQTELAKAKDITDFIETTINLSDETLTKGLTMSSKVFTVTLIANTINYIGYAKNIGEYS